MFPGKLLNFKLNRGIVQWDFNANFLHLLSIAAFLNRCARCTLGCMKICVGCTTTKGFTMVHHKLVTPNRYFIQKLSVSKNEPLTNQ